MALKNNVKAEDTMKYNVKVERAHRFPDGAISIDMTVNGVKIWGAYYRTKKDDPDSAFIAFPSRKGSDGTYYKNCSFPVSDVLLADIEDQIDSLLE